MTDTNSEPKTEEPIALILRWRGADSGIRPRKPQGPWDTATTVA